MATDERMRWVRQEDSMRPTRQRSWFTRFTKTTAHSTGRPLAFLLAVVIVAVWAITGPLFGFSDTWQLVINTGTTVVTFLMVFLIQATQNRDAEATQVKLDEIIRAIGNAKNELLDLEELEERDLDRIRESYQAIAREARVTLRGNERSPARTSSRGRKTDARDE
jgi:low affinity Fe/Cu permease